MLTPSELLVHSTLLHILYAFEKKGIWQILRQQKGISIEALAHRLSLDRTILEASCNFLNVNAPEILTLREEHLFLTDRFLESDWQNSLYFACAYYSVFTSLPLLLDGSKQYGRDVIRDSSYVHASSTIHNEPAWNAVIDYLHSTHFSQVVDCGCSGGGLLFRVCEAFPHIFGIGIEYDRAMAEYAKNTLHEKKLENRATIIEGDVGKPETWKHIVKVSSEAQQTVFIGITIWHEFLFDGKQHLIDILTKYRTQFSGCLFIMVEYNGYTWNEMSALPSTLREYVSVYQLVHPLTYQGLPQAPGHWRELLSDGGICVLDEILVEPNSTMYVCEL